MSLLIHLFVVLLVLAALFYFLSAAAIPQPAKWVGWIILFIIALYALLPFIGVHLPA